MVGPAWLHAEPAPADVVAVFDRAVYLRRGAGDDAGGSAGDDSGAHDVLPLLAPDALILPGALRVAASTDLDSLGVRVGDQVLVGEGEVHTPGGGLVVRRFWRPRAVPSAALPEPARQAALAGLVALEPCSDLLPDVVASRLTGPARSLVGLGPGLTPAGDDVLCGLLLGLRASGRSHGLARLEQAVLPLLTRTTALSATLLRQAAQGYAVPPLADLLHAWHRGASVQDLAAAGRRVADIGHTSGPALLLGLTAALTSPEPVPPPVPVASATGAARTRGMS